MESRSAAQLPVGHPWEVFGPVVGPCRLPTSCAPRALIRLQNRGSASVALIWRVVLDYGVMDDNWEIAIYATAFGD
jgi:hypothetical protein